MAKTRARAAFPIIGLSLAGFSLGALPAYSATVTIPSGTRVFGELDQQVTSNQKDFNVGDMVKGHVWRNVMVGGQTVIAAGAPMTLRVSNIKKRRIAGRGGDVKVQAVTVTSVDGQEISLDGGYDKEAGHRTALAASLSALVAWPLIFIRGKEAVLDAGTVFDASVPATTVVTVAGDRPPVLRLGGGAGLSVDVLEDEMDEKAKELPLKVAMCGQAWPGSANVTGVNEQKVDPIPVVLSTASAEGACNTARGLVPIKELASHFVRGINRFSITAGGETVEVILDVEM
jgi:hypothetical protein